MRCSSKSTTWPASAAIVALLALAGRPASAQAPDVARLIADAVQARFGSEAVVTVRDVAVSLIEGTMPTLARAEAGARTGQPVRFSLLAGTRPAGHAVATCRVEVPHARAATEVAAASTIDSAAVTPLTGDPGDVPFGLLPTAAELNGSTAIRHIAAGETLTTATVRVPFAVRSGERVGIRARAGAVEARTLATALQSGRTGDVIRVVTEGRRQLRVRVLSRGEGEVVHDR